MVVCEEIPEDDEAGDAIGEEPEQNWADMLGSNCTIQRVDKDKKVLGTAKPEEMQREVETRAAAQQRLGAVSDLMKDMCRQDKLLWGLQMKEKANALYAANKVVEASKLYNDCLCALDFEGSDADREEVQNKLQLPVCTNLAACMLESGQYGRCIELCNISLGVDPQCAKALYRRGLAYYRQSNFSAARPDLEAALASIKEQRDVEVSDPTCTDSVKALNDLERRATLYLVHIRRFAQQERDSCKRMFSRDCQKQEELYADRPDARPDEPEEEAIDDSDEALDLLLKRSRPKPWWSFCCRRQKMKDA